MSDSLTGRVALVTGASRGLGREIALELARRGADVAVMARTAESAEAGAPSVAATVSAVEALGRRAVAAPCDLTDDEAVTEQVARVLAELGRIDVLVNCAGVVSLTGVAETTVKRLDLLWKVNVRAPFLLMQLALPGMTERGSGHVVNVGALSSQWRGTQIPLGFPGYTATKAALVRLSHASALELHPTGVAVNVVAPSGFVPTQGWRAASDDAHELPNQEPPEYLARTVAWVVEQDPAAFTGRFVDSQGLLASLGELDGAPIGWDDLAMVDVSRFSPPTPVRVLPELTPATAPFWTAGADGVLRFQHCDDCGYFTHPPSPVCARCRSRNVGFAPVSGRGAVYALTENHHPWLPGWELPYLVAAVQLDEQDDLRLMTNIIGSPPDTVGIGDRVRVVFEHREDVWLPLFELEGEPA